LIRLRYAHFLNLIFFSLKFKSRLLALALLCSLPRQGQPDQTAVPQMESTTPIRSNVANVLLRMKEGQESKLEQIPEMV
jgi:hypothetical protein